jgi:hypothetical protein
LGKKAMEGYPIFEFFRSIETEHGLTQAFAAYLEKVRTDDEWVDDMLDGFTKEVLASDLLAGKYPIYNLLTDCIIDGYSSDNKKINEIAAQLFISDNKKYKPFRDFVYNECEVQKQKFKKAVWFKPVDGKAVFDAIYSGLDERFVITYKKTVETRNIKRLQWNGDTAALCTLLKDLCQLRTDKTNLPLLSASPNELKEFICNNFVNNKGEEMSIATIDKNIRDKPSIKGRIYVSMNPMKGR